MPFSGAFFQVLYSPVCKINSQLTPINPQPPHNQCIETLKAKKRRFSMREVPLFDARSAAFRPEKHRFSDEGTPRVRIFPAPPAVLPPLPSVDAPHRVSGSPSVGGRTNW